MKTTVVMAFLLSCALTGPQGEPGGSATPEGATTLCQALAKIGPGEHMSLQLSGIYFVGTEQQILYDPNEPICTANIQPATWVEFPDSVGRNGKLEKLLKKSGRAFVTLRGELFGPGLVGADVPDLAPMAAYADRVKDLQRYGHLNSFRTQFIVHEILDAKEVPSSVPHNAEWHQEARDPDLEVVQAMIPIYPRLPLAAGITGSVVIRVTVEAGRVIATDVLQGDRLLATAAIENVKTWSFKPSSTTNFETTFTFELERRARGNEAPHVELDLPRSVRITAAKDEW